MAQFDGALWSATAACHQTQPYHYGLIPRDPDYAAHLYRAPDGWPADKPWYPAADKEAGAAALGPHLAAAASNKQEEPEPEEGEIIEI